MSEFNAAQQRSILFGLLDLHHRMLDMEALLAQAGTSGPFSQYVADLSPTEARVVRDYFGRLRATMLASLRENDIPLDIRRTGLRWGLQVGMTTLSVAVAELSPQNLRGYGPLSSAGEATALKIQQELRRLIDRAAVYVGQGAGQDLSQRLARLDAAPAGLATLTLLDRVIARWQLVEFRPLLDTVVRRLEAPQFEIAVFGRVSSGKSSLLNHIAGADVLPVGVTPVTAVPTRLVRGDIPSALVSFAEVSPRRVPLERLGEYASEEGNPGNAKHVTDVLVQLPAPRLRAGVVLVDTPGVGSLALAGSAETYAYLPRCDLGVVLVDAGSTLVQEDLDLVRLLSEAGVPVQLLLSKADLLTAPDRARMAGYIHERLGRELGLDLPVHLVSTVGADAALLVRWFDDEIEPLLQSQRELTHASLRRKVAYLRESIVAVLQTLLSRQGDGPGDGRAGGDVPAARWALDEADAAIRHTRARCNDWSSDVPAVVELTLRDAARAVVTPADKSEAPPGTPVMRAIQQALTGMGQAALDLVEKLRETLARTLEELRRDVPGLRVDVAPIRGSTPRGLPAPDVSPLPAAATSAAPWWASLFPGAAAWAVRRSLERRLAPDLRESLASYDRLLRTWVTGAIAQVVELYESQAEIVRGQLLRLNDREGEGAGEKADRSALAADLRELAEAGKP